MGKAVSKEEVVVVNQNGQQEVINTRMDQFSVMLLVIICILVCGTACVVVQRCNRKLKNWLRKQVMVNATPAPAPTTLQHVLPSAAVTHPQPATVAGSYA